MSRKLAWLGGILLAVGAVVLGIVFGLRPPNRLPAVPEADTMRAEIPGIPNARYFVALDIEPFVRDVLAAREREAKTLGVAIEALPPASLLAVSGGGDSGAFGAGLLNGWTASGKRPAFKAVTGVSTGALIAPFAFAGPDYDHVLTTEYTTLGPADVAEKRNFLAAIDNDAMADNRPLWNQLSRFVDEALMKTIAAEYSKGRLLLIGTTDIDARQPVIWNVGAIASSRSPNALEVLRGVLVASAAIPGAFPPTMIKVVVDGKEYEEMHVDGGCSAQVFAYPPRMGRLAASMGHALKRDMTLYVIRNSSLRPTWAPVARRTVNIAGPAIASLIFTQGFGDLIRIYLTSQRDGVDFNLAIIEDDFKADHPADFDTGYMRALYDYGFRKAQSAYTWRKLPPRFEDEPPVPAGEPHAAVPAVAK